MTMRIVQHQDVRPVPLAPTIMKSEDIAAMPLDGLEAFLGDVNDEDLAPVLKRALSILAGRTEERPRRRLIMRWLKMNVYSEGFRRRR